MVSRTPLSSPSETMLTISRWNAMLDPGQYKIEDRYFEIEPFRSTFHSKTGPVSKEDCMRTRRRLRDTALNVKLRINNTSCLVQRTTDYVRASRRARNLAVLLTRVPLHGCAPVDLTRTNLSPKSC